MNEKGKKIFVKAMEERYDETFRHRSLGRNVSYKHLIKLECYKLLKDILGIEEYKPFKMYGNMYVIIVYDVGEKRVGKMLKLCRQYLSWIQNSVLEGELSEAKLRELQMKMKAIIDESEDSVIVFTNKMGYNMNKQILGKERMSTDNFL